MGVEAWFADILHNIKLHQNQLYLYSLRLANQKCTRFWRVTTWTIFGEGGASFELLFFICTTFKPFGTVQKWRRSFAWLYDPSFHLCTTFLLHTIVHQFLPKFWPLRPKTKRWRSHLWTAPFKIVILRFLWIDVKEVHIVKCKLYTIIVNNVFQLFFL